VFTVNSFELRSTELGSFPSLTSFVTENIPASPACGGKPHNIEGRRPEMLDTTQHITHRGFFTGFFTTHDNCIILGSMNNYWLLSLVGNMCHFGNR